MILRFGKTITIEFPDEQKAEVVEWILKSMFPEQAGVPVDSSATHRSVRPTQERLAGLESQRQSQLHQQSEGDRASKFRGPVMPWVTSKSGNPRDVK